MHLAKIREGRFVGVGSVAGSVDTWTTSVITLANNPRPLVINAVVRGSLHVEVLDASTLQPLAGYGESDAGVISKGDHLDTPACSLSGDDVPYHNRWSTTSTG